MRAPVRSAPRWFRRSDRDRCRTLRLGQGARCIDSHPRVRTRRKPPPHRIFAEFALSPEVGKQRRQHNALGFVTFAGSSMQGYSRSHMAIVERGINIRIQTIVRLSDSLSRLCVLRLRHGRVGPLWIRIWGVLSTGTRRRTCGVTARANAIDQRAVLRPRPCKSDVRWGSPLLAHRRTEGRAHPATRGHEPRRSSPRPDVSGGTVATFSQTEYIQFLLRTWERTVWDPRLRSMHPVRAYSP